MESLFFISCASRPTALFAALTDFSCDFAAPVLAVLAVLAAAPHSWAGTAKNWVSSTMCCRAFLQWELVNYMEQDCSACGISLDSCLPKSCCINMCGTQRTPGNLARQKGPCLFEGAQRIAYLHFGFPLNPQNQGYPPTLEKRIILRHGPKS